MSEQTVTLEDQVRMALVRGYCIPENSHKEMDSALVNAMAEEVMKIMPELQADQPTLEPQPSETNEFTCFCGKQKGWISENQITAPCPHCGRIYKGSYSQQYLKIIAVEQQLTQKSCEGCENYLTTKENPLVVCNIRSCKGYSHYQARKK